MSKNDKDVEMSVLTKALAQAINNLHECEYLTDERRKVFQDMIANFLGYDSLEHLLLEIAVKRVEDIQTEEQVKIILGIESLISFLQKSVEAAEYMAETGAAIYLGPSSKDEEK